jgi:hypothetical protein
MRVQVLDLDGSIRQQQEILRQYEPRVVPLGDWGRRIRLGCGFRRYSRFEEALTHHLGRVEEPVATLYGSGDFHHVSLALLRRHREPFNVLVLDNHPDWMKGLPFLHCGTWLYHAARLPLAKRVFHVGGNVDFDNAFRFMAPWGFLRSGKIRVIPAIRTFQGRGWRDIAHASLRTPCAAGCSARGVAELLAPWRAELARWPLYISVDKDVLTAEEAVVNWDSGHLSVAEVGAVLAGFIRAAGARLVGMDLLGDWSPVHAGGLFRRILHWTEHPSLWVDASQAAARNEMTNLQVLSAVLDSCGRFGKGARWPCKAS